MMSPTGSAIASPPSEPSCYEARPAEDDDVDLGVPDPMHRLVGARDVRGAVTVPGAAFERAAALTADSTTSARALYISRTCCVEVVNAFCIPRPLAIPQPRHRAPVIGAQPSAHWPAGHFIFTSTNVGRGPAQARFIPGEFSTPALEQKTTRSGTVRRMAPVP